MRIQRASIPTRVEAPTAVGRHQPNFGDASAYGELAAEYFTIDSGTDITGLLEGLEGDRCQSPHWGYVVTGSLTVSFEDGSEEVDSTGDLFYWPPGHTLRAEEDTEFVLFSPQDEHGAVLDHIAEQLAEM